MNKTLWVLVSLALFTGCSAKSTKKNEVIVEGRSIVADSGIVVSAHPESSRIGAKILISGGNAVSATMVK